MNHLKPRLLAIALIVLFSALTYINWQQLWSSGSYSTKLAAFGPVGLVGGLFLIAFPGKFGKPTTRGDKILVMVVFVVGLLAGLINWYLMDPGFFGR